MAVTGLSKGRLKVTSAEVAFTGHKFVTYIRWIGATTAGHSLVVNDADGDMVWESEADGANFIDVHPIFDIIDGITVATMQSGDFYIWIR